MTFKEVGKLFAEAASEWSEDNAARLGAALAYYTVFSLAPLLIIVIALVGAIWGGQSGEAQARILDEMRQLMGPEGARMVGTMLENASRPGTGGVLATVLGVAALLFGATGAFAQLQGALNTVWDVRPDPERSGLMTLITTRLLSFGAILVVGFLLLVSLVLSAALSFVGDILTDITPRMQVLMRLLNLLLSLGVITLLFAFIYRYLPDVRIAWRDVWVGAVITAILFTLGKYLLGLYLGQSGTASAYGAAGSLVVLLIWVYYSAQIFFFGAELTEVYARRYGSKIRPSAYAVWHQTAPEVQAAAVDRPETSAPPAPPQRSLWKRAAPLVLLAFVVGRFFGRR